MSEITNENKVTASELSVLSLSEILAIGQRALANKTWHVLSACCDQAAMRSMELQSNPSLRVGFQPLFKATNDRVRKLLHGEEPAGTARKAEMRNTSDETAQERRKLEQSRRDEKRELKIPFMTLGAIAFRAAVGRSGPEAIAFFDEHPKLSKRMEETLGRIEEETSKKEAWKYIRSVAKRISKGKLPVEFAEQLLLVLDARKKVSRKKWFKVLKKRDPELEEDLLDLDYIAPSREDLEQSA